MCRSLYEFGQSSGRTSARCDCAAAYRPRAAALRRDNRATQREAVGTLTGKMESMGAAPDDVRAMRAAMRTVSPNKLPALAVATGIPYHELTRGSRAIGEHNLVMIDKRNMAHPENEGKFVAGFQSKVQKPAAIWDHATTRIDTPEHRSAQVRLLLADAGLWDQKQDEGTQERVSAALMNLTPTDITSLTEVERKVERNAWKSLLPNLEVVSATRITTVSDPNAKLGELIPREGMEIELSEGVMARRTKDGIVVNVRPENVNLEANPRSAAGDVVNRIPKVYGITLPEGFSSAHKQRIDDELRVMYGDGDTKETRSPAAQAARRSVQGAVITAAFNSGTMPSYREGSDLHGRALPGKTRVSTASSLGIAERIGEVLESGGEAGFETQRLFKLRSEARKARRAEKYPEQVRVVDRATTGIGTELPKVGNFTAAKLPSPFGEYLDRRGVADPKKRTEFVKSTRAQLDKAGLNLKNRTDGDTAALDKLGSLDWTPSTSAPTIAPAHVESINRIRRRGRNPETSSPLDLARAAGAEDARYMAAATTDTSAAPEVIQSVHNFPSNLDRAALLTMFAPGSVVTTKGVTPNKPLPLDELRKGEDRSLLSRLPDEVHDRNTSRVVVQYMTPKGGNFGGDRAHKGVVGDNTDYVVHSVVEGDDGSLPVLRMVHRELLHDRAATAN